MVNTVRLTKFCESRTAKPKQNGREYSIIIGHHHDMKLTIQEILRFSESAITRRAVSVRLGLKTLARSRTFRAENMQSACRAYLHFILRIKH